MLAGTDGAQLPPGTGAATPSCSSQAGICGNSPSTTARSRDIAEAAAPAGATALVDGSILFAPISSGNIRRLQSGQATDATTLRPGDRAHLFPIGTGIGDDFVYTAVAENGRRTVRLVHDGEQRDLGVTSGHGQMAAGYLLVVRDDVLLAQQVDESGTLEEASRYQLVGDHDWRTKSVRGIAAHRAVGGGISASSRAGAGSTAVDCGSVRWASPETSGRCGWRLMIGTRCDRHRSPPSHARHHDRSIGIGSTQSTAHAGACGRQRSRLVARWATRVVQIPSNRATSALRQAGARQGCRRRGLRRRRSHADGLAGRQRHSSCRGCFLGLRRRRD